jgi:hypothetical protein
MMPHRVQTMREPKVGTGTSSDHYGLILGGSLLEPNFPLSKSIKPWT